MGAVGQYASAALSGSESGHARIIGRGSAERTSQGSLSRFGSLGRFKGSVLSCVFVTVTEPFSAVVTATKTQVIRFCLMSFSVGHFYLISRTLFCHMDRLDYVKYYDKSDGSLLLPCEALANARARLIPFGESFLVTELMACDRPKFIRSDYGLLGTVHRSPPSDDPPTPEDAAASLSRSRRRARRAVRDIMDCNDFEYFMTFTLDESVIDRTDYTAFIKAVNQYLGNRVRRYGWKYCAVVEYHKRTETNGLHALHLHAAVSGDKFNLVDSGTVVRPKPAKRKPVLRSTAHKQGYPDSVLTTVYNVTDWKYGHSTAIHTYGNRLALARYIAKYISKSDDKIGGRWYYSGGDLARPLYIPYDVDYNSLRSDVSFDSGDRKSVV